MKAIKPMISCLFAVAMSLEASAQTERMYFNVGDDSFKTGVSTNTKDAETNSFTIGKTYGSVYWAMRGKDISGYQYLVLRLKKVEGNTVRMIITDRSNTEYINHVDVSKVNGEQEIIVDLMQPLKSENGKKTLDLTKVSKISFWNYWDDGDGVESATLTIDSMYLEPYGGGSVNINNPIVQTHYTADPAPMVYGDRLYICTGHDEDGATNYTMNDWRLYSTADMVNWTDHGSPMDWSVYKWCSGAAWASQAIERNGKVYWYTSSLSKAYGHHVVGVAVADNPEGPFTAGAKSPLTKQYSDIDPSVFIDNDGQAYLYYGNNCLRYALLNDDMVSLKGGVHEIPLTAEGFGGVKIDGKIVGNDCFEEGPWAFRRGDTYYMVYAAGGVPEHISYSTSSSPTGPWTYRGVIMPNFGGFGSFTNHPGVLDFKGHSYFVYHNGALPGGSGFTRSVCVEEFKYNDDGTFPQIGMTSSGVRPIATLNPYEQTEAETIAWSYGVKTNTDSSLGVYVDSIDGGDYMKVREVEFGTMGATQFKAHIKGVNGGTMTVYADNPKSDALATIQVTANTDWQILSATLSQKLTGKHDLYFVFSGDQTEMMKFNWWQFATDDAAAVASVTTEKHTSIAPMYTLGGIKVDQPQKGINLHDGKAFIAR